MTTLQKLQSIEVEILEEIVRICNKHALTYFLVGGTLLGAVRHRGFIPWDDDLDIAMPRKDYNKFLAVCPYELNTAYALQYHGNEPHYISGFAKIRKKKTIFQEKGFENLAENGIWVDIFPLDYSRGAQKKGEQIKRKLIMSIRAVIGVRNGYFTQKVSPHIRVITKIANVLKLSNSQIVSIYTWLSASRKKGDYIVNQGSQYGLIKQTIPKDKYFPATELMFCGKMYSVPHDYDGVLRSIYGNDYMQLPPVEKRVTHNPVRLSFDTNGPDEVLEGK